MSWRDKGWNNPHKLPSDWFIYEAGADAILEALEFKGVVYTDGEWVRLALDTGMDKNMKLNGILIFIPEEDNENKATEG